MNRWNKNKTIQFMAHKSIFGINSYSMKFIYNVSSMADNIIFENSKYRI